MDRYSEVERKFDADPGSALPDLSGIAGSVGEAAQSLLDATYFDTADAALARHNVTLRRRTGGEDAGWHLKLPAGGDERTEVRLPLGRATRTVPTALARQVRAITRDRRLVAIATLHTTRVERHLKDSGGAVLATVADDTVVGQRLHDGDAEVTTWREVEVELLGGDRAFLDVVSQRLRAAGLTPSGSTSKLARVLGDSPSPRSVAMVDASRGAERAAAGTVVLAYLHEHLDQLVTCDRGVRSGEPDAVHDMRVAVRRLRATLATYQPLLQRERTDPVREELKWLGAVLGRARDAEVLRQRIRDLIAAQSADLDQGPAGAHLDSELDDRHRGAMADLMTALDGDRYLRLLDALDDLLVDPPLTAQGAAPAREQLPALVGRAAKRVDRAARAIGDDPSPQARDQGLHEVRKRVKSARYAAESAIPLAGKQAKRLANRMESLQDVLGEHQDSVSAQALLLQLSVTGEVSGQDGFTFGVLYAQEHARARGARRAYQRALRRASTIKARRWTR